MYQLQHSALTFVPMQKIYFPLVRDVVNILREVFTGKEYADKIIQRVLKSNPERGSRDRAFIAETAYDIVRHWRLLKELTHTTDNFSNADLFRIASAYFFFFKSIKWTCDEIRGFDPDKLSERFAELKEIRAVRESIPDWLDQMGEKELGDRWEKELKALNEQAAVVLRVNTLKSSKGEMIQELGTSGIVVRELQEQKDALVLEERSNVFSLPAFKEGKFEVQDAGSQLIGEFLGVEKGMRVIDACAGAGGKTLQLAALMGNKGTIIAMDVDRFKLEELKRRARRNGAHIIETRQIDSSKVIKRLQGSADRVLLDVPCSGLGTLRRNPDAKWKLDPDFLQRVKEKQQRILSGYSSMVKPGGFLVYATCSIFPSENGDQVETFLRENDAFELIKDRTVYPSEGFDGFYMALLRRK